MVVGVGVGFGFDCDAVLFGYIIIFLGLEFLVCEGVSRYDAGLNYTLAVVHTRSRLRSCLLNSFNVLYDMESDCSVT